MTPAPATVSVIIPCFNQERFVREAVASALAQSHPALEVIVVDDGSSRPVERLLEDVAVRVVRQENQGVSAARNLGLRNSTGEFVVFLDADDRLLRDAAAVGVGALTENPVSACAVGLCRVIDEEGRPAPFRQRGPLADDPYNELLRGNFIWMPGQVVFRRAALPDDPFDSSVNACADYDLYLRTARRIQMIVHDALVAEYRQHTASMSENGRLMLRQSLRVLGRQRAFLRTPARREAYRDGQRFWKEFYGDRVVEEVRSALRSPGRRRRAVPGILTLLLLHPFGALRQVLRKARVMTAGPAPAKPPAHPSSPLLPPERQSPE